MAFKVWSITPTKIYLGDILLSKTYLGEYDLFSASTISNWFLMWGWNDLSIDDVDWITSINTITPTTINPSVVISYALWNISWVSSKYIWLSATGWTWSNSTNTIYWIYGTDTITPTAINPTATVDHSRDATWAINNLTKWYICWWGTAADIDWINNTDTITPAAFSPTATLSLGRNWMDGINNLTAHKWFLCWGRNTNSVDDIDWITDTNTLTPTAVNPAAVISYPMEWCWAVNSSIIWFTLGWLWNGTSMFVIDWLNNTNTNTPTYFNPWISLDIDRFNVSWVSSTSIWHILGWRNGNWYLSMVDWISNTTTVTPTFVNTAISLSVNRRMWAAVQNGNP